jgi:phosphomannomutase / phosphoglucomutase
MSRLKDAMGDNEARAARLARMRPMLPVIAGLLALLALWMAWNGWRQWQGERDRSLIETSREQVVSGTKRVLQTESERITALLATPSVRAALARGDFAGAASALRQGWPRVEEVVVWPATLDAAYTQLPEFGFGRIAVAEAALSTNAAVARVAQQGKGAHLLIAAPARSPGRADAVAVARLPLARLTTALDAVDVRDDAFLALRQRDFTIAQRGDAALAGTAEALAANLAGTELRVSAAVPPRGASAFGLGAMASLGAAGVLALLAIVAAAPDAGDLPLTLAQTVEQGLTSPEKTSAAIAISGEQAAPAQSAGVSIDPGIFRAYDIRGVVGETLDRDVADYIGQAVGSLMQEKGLADIVVGRDGRLSGPDLVAGLVAGLRKAGRNVIDIGLAPTPLVYFGSYHLRTGCCIAVTGSHNPPDYNGFKIVVGGETLSGEAITDLYARIAENRLHAAPEPGTFDERAIDDDYVARIADDVQLQRRLKVVVDAGNGVAGDLGPRVLEAIGAEVVPLFCDIDGTFPNHHPDPSDPHNLEDLVRTVGERGADLGVAFDGDGDRLGVVTRAGENIFPDRLLMLFAADVLDRMPGATIIYDVKCTGHLASQVLRHGGSPLMWKTGHSLIKAKMRETDAALAGEMSGHFFFAERWYGFDDGIYAAARLLEILAAADGTPDEVLQALPAGVSTPEIKIEAPEGNPHAFVEGFRAAAQFEDGRVSSIDGVRVDWPDGWGLIRASNTTPVLVLRFDADSDAALKRVQGVFREQLLAFRPELPVPF